MFHVELRQFPHNACRFNLDEHELRALLDPWVREKVVEVGERKWSPHQARLTILEGPPLELADLRLGRGWRSAQRRSQEVTERVLAAVRQAVDEGAGAAGQPVASAQPPGVADPVTLGVQLAALLGAEPVALLQAWRSAAAASPGLAPSESLAQAERALGSADATRR